MAGLDAEVQPRKSGHHMHESTNKNARRPCRQALVRTSRPWRSGPRTTAPCQASPDDCRREARHREPMRSRQACYGRNTNDHDRIKDLLSRRPHSPLHAIGVYSNHRGEHELAANIKPKTHVSGPERPGHEFDPGGLWRREIHRAPMTPRRPANYPQPRAAPRWWRSRRTPTAACWPRTASSATARLAWAASTTSAARTPSEVLEFMTKTASQRHHGRACAGLHDRATEKDHCLPATVSDGRTP